MKMRDLDVRAAVRDTLGQLHAGDSGTRIVEEMGIWSSTVRIDIATINGELSGFELKSDSDTLERLPYQSVIYGKVFDRLTLVVGERHLQKALLKVPDWWGCWVASMESGAVALREVRGAGFNPQPDASVVAQLLWKQEAVAVLEEHNLARGWRSKPARAISERLSSELPLPVLREHVRDALKARPRLGQLRSSELDVTVDGEADPTGWTARRGGRIGCNTSDHSIPPAMLQWCVPSGGQDGLGVPAILNRSINSAGS